MLWRLLMTYQTLIKIPHSCNQAVTTKKRWVLSEWVTRFWTAASEENCPFGSNQLLANGFERLKWMEMSRYFQHEHVLSNPWRLLSATGDWYPASVRDETPFPNQSKALPWQNGRRGKWCGLEQVKKIPKSFGLRKKAAYGLCKETLGLKSRLSDLGIDDKNFALMAKKACGKKGKLEGFTTLTPHDVEEIFKLCK